MNQLTDKNSEEIDKFEEDELEVWRYQKKYFIDVLNGELPIQDCRENLASFRNSIYYTGSNPKYKKIIED